jgi:hypothetical protein
MEHVIRSRVACIIGNVAPLTKRLPGIEAALLLYT